MMTNNQSKEEIMMNQKIIMKVISTILVMILTMVNFITLGVYMNVSYALQESLENQTTISKDGNIEFDTYFIEKNGAKIHEIEEELNNKERKINIEVGIKKGYLKNAKIQINGEQGEANFRINNNNNELNSVETIDEKAS